MVDPDHARREREIIERCRGGWQPTSVELASAPLLDCWSRHPTEPGRLRGFIHIEPFGPYPVMTLPAIWVSRDPAWMHTQSRLYALGRSLRSYTPTPEQIAVAPVVTDWTFPEAEFNPRGLLHGKFGGAAKSARRPTYWSSVSRWALVDGVVWRLA